MPNTHYVGDITYLPVADGTFCYLATVMDLCSRWLHRYDTRRRHSYLGQRSPIPYENSLDSTSATLPDVA